MLGPALFRQASEMQMVLSLDSEVDQRILIWPFGRESPRLSARPARTDGWAVDGMFGERFGFRV